MIKQILSIFFFIIYLNFIGYNQKNYNNLIIYSDDSVSFILTIDDNIQNNYPHYNVKITNLSSGSHSLNIIIKDGYKQTINKKIYFEKNYVETSAKIINVENKYKFRFIGEVEMGMAAVDSNQLILHYKTNNNIKANLDSLPINNDTTISYHILKDSSIIKGDSIKNNRSYDEKKGCSNPEKLDLEKINSLDKEYFSSDKLLMAKDIVFSGCNYIDDIVLILNKLEFEDHKLELAKFAYYYIYDIENFPKIIDLMRLSSSKDKLKAIFNDSYRN